MEEDERLSEWNEETNVCYVTFCSLWEQLRNITSKTLLPNYDDIIICINLVDQMVHLLQLEILEEQLGYPCLQLIMKENIPAHILGTSRMPVHIDLQEKLQLHLLRLYLTIFEKPSIFESFLPCESISKPLFELLSELDENNNNNNINDAMNQNLNFSSKNCVNDLQVINLMSQICGELMCNESLLYLFQESDSTKISKNSVMPFRFLTKFIHNDKWIGQQARDAMLGCVSLSERVPDLDYYISEYTDFCPVLATGLSALYSSLPRRFSLGNDSCSLTDADIVAHSPLRSFFTSLTFCNAVIQMSQKHVRRNVLDLVHMGFLVPVLGPSLTQSYDEELISATAYCDLCIRATNSHLLGLFLKFLFTSNIEEIPIIDILTQRLQVKNKLSLVTLKLFYSLIDLNCEDVQFWLILKYLVPLSHILPPHRACIIQPDLHSRASEKFLALVPICCQRENSEEQDMNQSRKRSIRLPCCCYTYYLHDARLSVRYNLERTKFWVFPYDGVNPSVKGCNNSYSQECVAEDVECSTNAIFNQDKPKCTQIDHARLIYSRYNSILSQSQPNLKKLEQDESKFSRSLDNFTYSYDNWDYSKKEVVKDEEIPVKVLGNLDESLQVIIQPPLSLSAGPFLETLFDRVESMVSNGLTANLLITSIISRLAAYPQPLLKTILLHPDPIFQPWVRNLFKSIMTLKQHIDDTMPSLEGSDEALIEARRYLNNRIHSVDSDNSSLKKSQEIKPRRSLSNTFSSFFRRKPESVSYSSLPDSAVNDRVILNYEVQNYAMTAIIMEDWLKELSAIAHEQSVLQKELSFQFGMGLPNV
ncbi:FHIP family protein v1g243165 isoform X1 [Lepeophtheirus salmonis]|nr:protein FAM160A1-like isoform X2 [Lepeophtheirus salmonis]XP_040570383.1 protein FAM160A1-like isoform X2 [Lepeophtheirus salmonis]